MLVVNVRGLNKTFKFFDGCTIKDNIIFSYRNVIVQIYAHPNGKMNGVAKWLLVMVQITVKAS